MNKQDIINKLSNTHLDEYDRESLCQLLHYMNVEGINNTSSNNNNTNNSHKHTSDKRTSSNYSSNYKGNKPYKRTSSNNTR